MTNDTMDTIRSRILDQEAKFNQKMVVLLSDKSKYHNLSDERRAELIRVYARLAEIADSPLDDATKCSLMADVHLRTAAFLVAFPN